MRFQLFSITHQFFLAIFEDSKSTDNLKKQFLFELKITLLFSIEFTSFQIKTLFHMNIDDVFLFGQKKTALNFCCHSQLLNDNPLTVNFMQSLALSTQFT